MKVEQQYLDYISKVIKTAGIAKISNIIIEPNRVRAIDDGRSVIILQTTNVPDMPFGSIGINRIDVFSDRLNIAQSMSNFSVDVTIKGADTETPWAQALAFKGKGIKVDYRCANPLTIQAPKAMNDPCEFQIDVTDDLLDMLHRGQSAMKADIVSFIGDEDGVHIEMADINGDTLDYQISNSFDKVGSGESESFNHKFPIKTITPILKACSSKKILFTAKGLIKIVVNNLDLYLVPST